MGRGIYSVGDYTVGTKKSVVSLDLDSFLEAIDKAPSEKISAIEYVGLNIKMARLLKESKGF